jgi:hypothetical protein
VLLKDGFHIKHRAKAAMVFKLSCQKILATDHQKGIYQTNKVI